MSKDSTKSPRASKMTGRKRTGAKADKKRAAEEVSALLNFFESDPPTFLRAQVIQSLESAAALYGAEGIDFTNHEVDGVSLKTAKALEVLLAQTGNLTPQKLADALAIRGNAPVEQTGAAKELFAAVTECVEAMGEQLRAGDDPREVANSFLVGTSNRFDHAVGVPDYHEKFGYNHHARQIRDNINRWHSPIKNHGRLDAVLRDLISEATRLAESQSIFCEHCEHCLRERYKEGFEAISVGEGFATEATLDAATWKRVVERFGEFIHDSMGEEEAVVVLRHLESLAWVGRPEAVKECVNQLIDSLLSQTVNEDERREEYEKKALARVKDALADLDKQPE